MTTTKLRIHTWPEKILRVKCKPVKAVDQTILKILDEMLALMRVNIGIGLAAPQVGLELPLIVIEFENKILKLVNPQVVKKEGNFNFLEGCLSFPGLEMNIRRAKKIKVAALNEKNEPLEITAHGLMAVVLQHEIDHINGVVFIDRASFLERLKAEPQLRKIINNTHKRLKDK